MTLCFETLLARWQAEQYERLWSVSVWVKGKSVKLICELLAMFMIEQVFMAMFSVLESYFLIYKLSLMTDNQARPD